MCTDLGHGTSLCVWIPGMRLVCVYGSRAWDWFMNNESLSHKKELSQVGCSAQRVNC